MDELFDVTGTVEQRVVGMQVQVYELRTHRRPDLGRNNSVSILSAARLDAPISLRKTRRYLFFLPFGAGFAFGLAAGFAGLAGFGAGFFSGAFAALFVFGTSA